MKSLNSFFLLVVFLSFQHSNAQASFQDDKKMQLILNKSFKDHPNRWHFKSYIKSGIGSARHKSLAKRNIKHGNKELALHHLFLGFSTLKKKGKIKRYKKVFTPELTNDVMTQVGLKIDSITQAIKQQDFIKKAKTQLRYITYLDYLKDLNHIKTSSITPIDYNVIAFNKTTLDQTKADYNTTRKSIAPYYYDLAIQKETQAVTKADWKKVSSYYAIARIYDKEYKDALQRENEAVDKSVYTIAVYPEHLKSSTYKSLDKSLQMMIKEQILPYTQREDMRHISLVSEGEPADFRVNLSVSNIMVNHKNPTSEKATYERDIPTGKKDAEGKDITKTVRASVTYYRKESYTTLKIFAEIVDGANGQIILTKSFQEGYTWHTKWHKFSGNEDALTKKQKRKLGNTAPEETPPNRELIQQVVDGSVRGVSNTLNSDFIGKKGGVHH